MREILELEDNCNIERWEHLLACITPEDVEPFNDAISRILTGHNIVNVNFRANTAAGIKPLTLHGDVYRDAHGIPVVLEGVIQMRSVSAATEQMQYVTTLLMDTVHSVNNKLTAILGSTAMLASLLNDAQAPQRSGQYLEEIEHEVFLSAELLRQLVQAAKRR
ncbi:MAG: hypothetical protein JXX14_07860 [Deltaproteobacteria bacterium]|nr:hypothetical protein [Deltaproteobacteria bacterium]